MLMFSSAVVGTAVAGHKVGRTGVVGTVVGTVHTVVDTVVGTAHTVVDIDTGAEAQPAVPPCCYCYCYWCLKRGHRKILSWRPCLMTMTMMIQTLILASVQQPRRRRQQQ